MVNSVFAIIGSHSATELESLFDSFGLIQHISEPTRGSNMLDHLVSESGLHISDVVLDDAGLILDHRLIEGDYTLTTLVA